MGGAVFLRFRASWVVPCASRTGSRKTVLRTGSRPRLHPACGSVVGHARLAAGRRLSLHEVVCSRDTGRSDRVNIIGRCGCLAIGKVYGGCDRSGPWQAEREKTSGPWVGGCVNTALVGAILQPALPVLLAWSFDQAPQRLWHRERGMLTIGVSASSTELAVGW